MTEHAYRYTLTRRIPGEDLFIDSAPKTLAWLMLNPSTADTQHDDPTIRKVVGFTYRAGYSSLVVANLYPLRATSPSDLHAVTEEARLGDAEAADEAIAEAVRSSIAVVLAWGHHGVRYPERVRRVAQLVTAHRRGPVLALLGMTRGGQPRHPLMPSYDTPLLKVDDYLQALVEVGRG